MRPTLDKIFSTDLREYLYPVEHGANQPEDAEGSLSLKSKTTAYLLLTDLIFPYERISMWFNHSNTKSICIIPSNYNLLLAYTNILPISPSI